MIIKSKRRTPARRQLNANYDWKEVESRVRTFYVEANARELVSKRLARKKPIGWYEGPPTLNNQPHMGHVRGRMMKDLYYRWSALRGENVVFRGGWDTQGLPVELQAEKELGLSGNKWENLRQVGVEKLVQACKDLITKYRKDWEETDRLLGLMLDQDKGYMTYRDEYIEREWKYLQTAWDNGLLGEGYKVVPYCPSCQTSLSQAELALGGYELLDDPSLYYKVRTGDGSFIVVWTTMPFTVVTDELVAVKPNAEYEYVRVGDETWVVGSERKEALSKETGLQFGQTVKRIKGEDLEGLTYTHPLLGSIPGLNALAKEGRIHKVVAEDFVDTTTGTGLVHVSPANGEDDFSVAQKRGIPVFAPLDDQVRFTAEAGRFDGLFARDADSLVASLLKESGAMVHEGHIKHDYPVCWRSGHRLIWLSRREYFYWVDKIRTSVVEAADAVEYFYEGSKNRFMEFLRVISPWCITRERIWGTPLPVWVCSKCEEKIAVFSRKRIVELAKELPDGPNFELHRPWMDRIILNCPRCGGEARREQFVLDTWHNSGSAPYSSFTDAEYRKFIPARFLTEGIDQTRGWAYTLLVLNVIKSGRPLAPYRAFLFQGHVLDDKGRKMSKSLGNVIWGLDLLREKSVDLVRFYLAWKSSPEDSLSMDLKEMSARPYQVLNTLYHLHVYLAQNGEVDGYDPRRHTVAWARKKGLLEDVDEWLLAKMRSLEKTTSWGYSAARYNEACKAIEEAIIGQISQNYVRLVRSDLWKDDVKERDRRLAIYATLGHALRRVDALLHPVAPFITEFLFQETFAGTTSWVTPLLVEGAESTPAPERPGAEKLVEFALRVEDACNSARTKAKLKRRWPLRSLTVLADLGPARTARKAAGLISSLCNVREVDVLTSAKEFPATFILTPNASKLGLLFKSRAREVLQALDRAEGQVALRRYLSGEPVRVKLPSGEVEVPLEAYDLQVTPNAGFEVAERDGVFVAIDKERDEGLVAEGLARDLARRLQTLRKERGFTPTKVLSAAIVAGLDDEELLLLGPLKKELAFLVRVRDVELLGEKSREEGLGRGSISTGSRST